MGLMQVSIITPNINGLDVTKEKIMKRLFSLVLVCLLVTVPAMAFLYSIDVLSPAEISKLSNKELSEIYQEAKLEQLASSEFHEAAGFSNAKDYKRRKDMLRYIVHLRKEMAKRELQPDPIDEWLK